MTAPKQPGRTLVSHSLSQTKRLAAQAKPDDVIVLAPGEHGARQPRGFATMDPKRRSEISSLGGKAAHEAGGAHEWTSAEAAAAGKKGGSAVRERKAAKP